MPALVTTTAEAGIGLPPELLPDVLDLAARDDFGLWERQLARCGNCAHPIRLQGQVEHVNKQTGEVREVYSTDTEPAGVLLKACGNRRAAVCPGCAEVYRADAYQLIKAGLRGGKGIPDTVIVHPRVFATFTAPSFGPVHCTRRRCHPRRRARVCPHGTRPDCRAHHHPGDPRLGEPLCPACYDYPAQVLWNALAPELWRRTRIYLDRTLARLAGLSIAALRRPLRR